MTRLRATPLRAVRQRVARASALATGLLVAGCDVPTGAPIIDSRWLFDVHTTTIGVEGLLPDSVSIDDGAFAVEASPVVASEELGDLCPTCRTSPAELVPKPAFTGSFEARANLPSGLSSGEIASGDVQLTFVHDFDFDPIRPSGGAPGSLVATLTEEAGGRVLARLEFDGATDSLPPGWGFSATLPLAPGAIGGALAMRFEIESPAGGTAVAHRVSIDAQDQVRATATPVNVRLSSARTDVLGRSASLEPAEVDVAGVDVGIVDRIHSGALVLEIANAFGAALDAQLHIVQEGDTVVSKPFKVPGAPTSTTSVELTADEFRAFLGKPGVMLAGAGVVTSPADGIVLTPVMEVQIDGKIDLVLRVGG